jgi:hypothetical protein
MRCTIEGWREHALLRRELESLEARGELERTLVDSGIGRGGLPLLMRAHPGAPGQLARMMRRLGLDRAALTRSAGMAESLREMEWQCGACTDWRKCRAWLASGDAPERYREFCPNAQALDALRCGVTSGTSGVLAELEQAKGEGFEG